MAIYSSQKPPEPEIESCVFLVGGLLITFKNSMH